MSLTLDIYANIFSCFVSHKDSDISVYKKFYWRILLNNQSSFSARDPFYIIAHMTNTPRAVDWAVAKGANAVEIDLEFTSNGEPYRTNHSPNGEACDCTCMCPK